jgi:hypothetical protein
MLKIMESLRLHQSNYLITGDELWLHIDNATPYNSQISMAKIDELGFMHVAQPPYSPDIVRGLLPFRAFSREVQQILDEIANAFMAKSVAPKQ